MNLLSRGLIFSPTLRHIHLPEFSADISDFIRRLRLREYYHDNDSTESSDNTCSPFRVKSTWTPQPGRDNSLNAFANTIEHTLLNSEAAKICDNQGKRERKAIKRLTRRDDIIIKPADKGLGKVVMDMDRYENECLRQLNNTQFYEKIVRLNSHNPRTRPKLRLWPTIRQEDLQ